MSWVGSFSPGDEVVVAGGAYAGEVATVVAVDGELVTVELSLAGQPTRMAFDVTALARPNDPRPAFRADLEAAYQRASTEDMLRWFSERPEGEDPIETDDLGMLYQIASPLRREYLAVVDEFDALFTDALLAGGAALVQRHWSEHRERWLARLVLPTLEEAARERAQSLRARVRAAVPQDEDERPG